MALSAGNIIEVQSAGSDANAGFFDPSSANCATDLTTDTNTADTDAPVVSSASYNFIARDVGHWLFIKSGTNWVPGWYQIASVASNKATLNASIGAGILSQGNVPAGATTAVGIATVGTPTGGVWSVDYSQSTAAGVTFTDLVLASTTTFTSAANPIGKNFVGNGLNVTSGTGFTVQRVQIISVTGTTGTGDKNMGTNGSTGGNAALGGALASPGMAGAFMLGTNQVHIKSGTYVLSASSNVSGGRVTNGTAGTAAQPNRWIGYGAMRGDGSTKPVFKSGANSVLAFTGSGAYSWPENIEFRRDTVAGHTAFTGIRLSGSNSVARRCSFYDCDGTGAETLVGTSIQFVDCYAESCVTGFEPSSNGASLINCVATLCTSRGFFSNTAGAFYAGCVAFANAGVGFQLLAAGNTLINCTAYGQTGANIHGFGLNAGGNDWLINCLSVSNGTSGTVYGFNLASIAGGARLINCASYGNFTADYNPATTLNVNLENFIALTADPFIDAAGGDFRLNSTAGGGALLKGVGYPQAFPGLEGVPNFPDIGAYQPAAAAVVDGAIFVPQGPLGSGSNKTTQTTVSTTTAIQIGVGQMAIFAVASDNESTTDGQTALHASVTLDGNGAAKLGEYTNGQGAANAGVTVSLWYLVNTTGVPISAAAAIVATHTVGKDAKVVLAHLFDWDETYTVVADGLATVADDAIDPSSITATGTLDVPHLWVRAIAYETSNTAAGVLTPTSGWTAIPGTGTTGGADATNVSVRLEYKVSSGASSGASNPTGVAVDSASVLAGLAATLEGDETGGGGVNRAALASGLSALG